ncbi:putative myosin-1-like [Scophthalmus maximus]|uniref:Putative myosin-1-like n=1 Tax=Scophthalmus maximus TaxID=52904 RepID=A0A2U9BX99_SCOMX|nr:putative myosin-1-like [Scophthalmus maximus]
MDAAVPTYDANSTSSTSRKQRPRVTPADPMHHNADLETLNARGPAVEQDLSLTSAPCPTDSGGTILLQLLQFKTHLLEAVEELHIRKDAETHFEDQISKLALDKQELEWEKESLQHQIQTVVHQHTESLTNVRKQFQAKIRITEEEKGKYQVSAELKDKEINNLKEELRSLQLLKYNLEKKSKELEQKLSLQSRLKDSHLNQLGEVEKRFGALSRQCAMVRQAHEKLEQNVDEAMRINKKLTSANEKHEATIVSLRKELAEANNKLIKAKTTSVRREASHVHTGKEQHIEKLQQKLSMETEMNKKLGEENVAVRAEKQEVMRSLQQNQQLLLSQTQTVNRVERELQTQREQNQALKQEHEAMRDKSKAAEDKAARLMESCAAAETSWDKEKKMLLDRIETEQRELQAAKDAHDELHQKHAELSSQAVVQAQHMFELETRTSRQSRLRVSTQLFPPDEPTSSSELPQHSASSQAQNPDRPDDTGATGGEEASNHHLQSELKQPSNSGTTGTGTNILNECIKNPFVVSDSIRTASSVSDDNFPISKGSCVSGTEEKNVVDEEEGNTGMSEEKHGGEDDDEGQERNNRKEEEGNAEELWNGGEDAKEGGRAGEKGGTPTNPTTGSAVGREDTRGSAEDTRNPQTETRDRAEGRGTDGAETQIPAQTTTDYTAERSNTLQVVDFADTEPLLVVCEQDADSRHEDEGQLLRSFGSDDVLRVDHKPKSATQVQNLRHGDDEVHTRDRLPSAIQVSEKTPENKSASDSEPLRVCSSPTNVVPSATDGVVSIQELETTADPSEPYNNNLSDMVRTDEMCRIQASEESVRTSVEKPQSQETSELQSLTTEEDDADSSAKGKCQVSNVDTKHENCDGESVCVDVTMDSGCEETSGSCQDQMKNDKTDDAGDPETNNRETDVNVSVTATVPRSSVLHQFVQGSESNTSVSCGRLRLPPSRKPTFPKSKPCKVPLVITKTSALLNPSGVSRTLGEWNASGDTVSYRTRGEERRASLSITSFPVPVSFSTVSGLSWPTTPGAPTSGAGPVSHSDSEPSCSQEREEQQASFRAQISKIEEFLNTERLRLPKRRRTDN